MLTKDAFEDLVSQRTGVPREQLDSTSRLGADLGLDSFALLELIAALTELDVELNEREWVTVGTVGDLYDRYRARAELATPAAAAEPVPGRATAEHAPTSSAELGPPVLAGQFFRLVPVLPPALPFLYSLAVSQDVGFRWRYRGSVPPYPQFEQELWHGMLVQFLVESIQTNQPAGHLICYNADLNLGHAYVGAAMASPYLGTGIAAEPVRLFINYLFDVWPLHKLYLEMPEFNYQQFASAGERALRVEARLRDHDYYRGRRWDRIILAAYRPDQEIPAGPENFASPC
ncbi:phosphopantetheine-binding protein [Parafrankia elaeagni]|uniref:phosphopantetheine-binding protein n=1 Tax=Parafrankia elaeagni TaxID=222534 RepID=UPI00036E82B2|nr:phosphopantetheine-binding protein [Parafrankia elaeagni]